MGAGDKLFYFPTRAVYGRPETYNLAYESVNFNYPGGPMLHGWYFPANGEPRGTVVHCHGNSGNITGHFEFVKWLPERGWNLFCFDYRGYGQSEGEPTRQGTVDDAHAALDYVLSRGDVDTSKVVMFGQSLGGAIGTVVAGQRSEVRALAVEGAFSNYRREAAFVSSGNAFTRPFAGWLSRHLISEGLEPIDWVGKIAPRPTLFVCGTKDQIVDYHQTVALHEAAGDPKTLHVIDGGGHTDSTREETGRSRIAGFLEQSLNGQQH